MLPIWSKSIVILSPTANVCEEKTPSLLTSSVAAIVTLVLIIEVPFLFISAKIEAPVGAASTPAVTEVKRPENGDGKLATFTDAANSVVISLQATPTVSFICVPVVVVTFP